MQDRSQTCERESWSRAAMLFGSLLGLLVTVWFVVACMPLARKPAPTESLAAVPETPTTAPSPTATAAEIAPVGGSPPLTTGLKATVVAGLPPTPTPDASGATPWGKIDIGILPLAVQDHPPLWAVFSQGMDFYDPEAGHFVAIYTHTQEGWQEVARVVLTSCAEYVGAGSLAQVELEPSRIWLEMQSGAGVHSGCYDLLSFDGGALHVDASNVNSSPGAGWLQDLDNDGIAEVILDHTDDYVFCYACGLRLPLFEVLRWDGEVLEEVRLTALPGLAPPELQRLNNRAVELAQAGLWADAQATISETLPLDLRVMYAPTVIWNAALINLHAMAMADQVSNGIYPLLQNILYGDYAAAIDVMRPYSVEEIWGPETPLITGTAAEGWEYELTNRISQSTNLALGAKPDLAPAYFLRGWSTHLGSPGDPSAVADVEHAATLAPEDPLFAGSAAYLQVPISPGPPDESIGFEPLPPETCHELGQAMMLTLGVTVTQADAPFEDYLLGGSGTGCQSVATGSGADFEDVASVAGDLKGMLEARGWHEDAMYAADGPTGTAAAFRQEGKLCLLGVDWSPADDAECPSDQPISACDLAPEQKLYTVQLNCAQQGGALPQPVPTPTPIPTPTPTPTPTPIPTPTPTPTPIPTPTPMPIPTATPIAEEYREVRTLLAGPGEPGRLYALLTDPSSSAWPASRVRLLISDDYGDTWAPFPGGLPAEGCVYNVNLDYGAPPPGGAPSGDGGPDAVYASTCQGLYRWSGSEWLLISPQETGMVAVVYGQPEIVWATSSFSSGGAVLRSDDGGATWTPAGSGLISFNGVANVGIDPRDSNLLYAIIWPKYAGSYLRRGTAGGLWQTMPTPQNNSVIGIGMTIDGATGALYVVVTSPESQLWRTTNPDAADVNDVRWEKVHNFGRDVAVDLLASGWGPEGLALYANVWPLAWKSADSAEAGEPLVHRSLDGGRTWTPLPIP